MVAAGPAAPVLTETRPPCANYAGLEVPSAAGEEMTNPRRDVPFAVLWSALATILDPRLRPPSPRLAQRPAQMPGADPLQAAGTGYQPAGSPGVAVKS